MNEIHPWHIAQWMQCHHRIRKQTLPHALLLSGPAGVGKYQFARRLTQMLLCEQASEAPCERCQGCRLFAAGTHPDHLEIATEEDARQIKIDQIRALNYFVTLSRSSDRHKIAVIRQADEMNRFAANSLLKTLEEPPPFSLILLVTAHSSSLPATLVSRCQRVAFKIPSREVAVTWLQRQVPAADAPQLLSMARGAPLLALEMSRDTSLEVRRAVLKDLVNLASGRDAPVVIAARWKHYAADSLLRWLLSWLTDIAKFSAFSRRTRPDIDPDLRALSGHIDSTWLFSLYDEMLDHRRQLSTALNQQLMYEDIVLAWAKTFNRTR